MQGPQVSRPHGETAARRPAVHAEPALRSLANIHAAAYAGRSGRIGTTQRWHADIPAPHSASALALCIDGALIVLISIFASSAFEFAMRGWTRGVSEYAATGVIVAVLFCGLVRLLAVNDPRASTTRLGRARMAAVAWSVTFLFLVVLAFGMKISAHFSRGAIFSFFAVGFAGMMLSRMQTPRLLSHWMKNSAYRGAEVLVVAPGDCPESRDLVAELAQRGCKNVLMLEFDDGCSSARWVAEKKRLLQSIFDTARAAAPGEIYLLAGRLPVDAVSGLMSGLCILPRAVYLVPDDGVSMLFRHPIHDVGGMVALEMQKTPMTRNERLVKRLMDIAIAGTALVLLSPLLLGISLAVAADSRGPILFRQSRLGYRGRQFTILKFRTMTVLENGDVIRQASRNDRRVTRIGKRLRQWSLDELPQLWNVLHGEMSIVGPRPHAAAHDALYTKLIGNYEVRQHVKPGITGWAQVQGLRGETPNLDLMYRRIEMDIWYACNSSLALDVQILFKTFGAVLSQKNAF